MTSAGALITAVGGFIVVLLRLRNQQEKLDRVDAHLNGEDGEPMPDGSPTIGQRISRIEHGTEEGFSMVRGHLDALQSAMRQFGRYFDEHAARTDARLAELEELTADDDPPAH